MSTKVSVVCTCYNHEKYIEQTLLSILNQTVDFEYELLIHDDCSPDNSRKIIDRVFNEYSGKCQIKRIYPEENIYSKGSSAVLFNMLPHVDGEFIAFCEGDDYWVDDNKLQKQLEALANHKDINACFHPSLTLLKDQLVDKKYGYQGDLEKKIPYQYVIKKGGDTMPMASMFIRKEPFFDLIYQHEDFFKLYGEHSVLQIINSIEQGAWYLPEKMSVYRSMHEGSWSLQQAKDPTAEDREFEQYKIRILGLNKIYRYKYWICFLGTYLKKSKKHYLKKIKRWFKTKA